LAVVVVVQQLLRHITPAVAAPHFVIEKALEAVLFGVVQAVGEEVLILLLLTFLYLDRLAEIPIRVLLEAVARLVQAEVAATAHKT
jgi:hypothetical protein